MSTKPVYDVTQSKEMNLRGIITPSCTSITILGQLLLLSKEDDFRLVDAGKKVEHIKHPESFRACLMQLTHESWSAFNTAERNMNKVLQNVEVMPESFENVNEILVDGEVDDLVCLLPTELDSISLAAGRCVKYTTECEQSFEAVKSLIEEIVELCNVKDKALRDQHDENIALEGALKREEEGLASRQKDLEAEQEKKEADLRKAKGQYNEALESQPGVMAFVVGAGIELFRGRPGASSSSKKSKKKGKNKKDSEYKDTMKGIEIMMKIADDMVPWMEGDLLRQDINTTDIISIERRVKNIPKNLKKEGITELGKQALDICKSIRSLRDISKDVQKEANIVQDINVFVRSVDDLKMTTESLHSSESEESSDDEPAPGQAQGQRSAYSDYLESKQTQLKVTETRVTDVENQYEKFKERQRETEDKMLKLVNELTQLDRSSMSVTKMREVLVQALSLFTQIRQQWCCLTQYFQQLADVVSKTMNTEIDKFEKQAKSIESGLSKENPIKMTSMMKKKLKRTTDNALKSVEETRQVSSFYVNVSRNYLMPNLKAVYAIETSVGQRSKEEVMIMSMELEDTCKNTIQEINDIACDVIVSSRKLEGTERQALEASK